MNRPEVKEQRNTHHGNQDITNSFNGRLVSFAGFHECVETSVDLQHVGQIGEEQINKIAETVVQ
jgi:hypothetical protein